MGWAGALGQAILGGNQGYRVAREDQRQQVRSEELAKLNGLNMAILNHQIERQPKADAQADMATVLQTFGEDAFNQQSFVDLAKQAGTPLETKQLPPWAPKNPGDFGPPVPEDIRKNLAGIAPTTNVVIPKQYLDQRKARELQQQTGEASLTHLQDQPTYATTRTDAQADSTLAFERQKELEKLRAASSLREAQVRSGFGGSGMTDLDPKTSATLKLLLNYQLPLPSGNVLRQPYWQNLIETAGRVDPSFDVSQYASRAALRKDFSSGKGAANIRSLNTAIKHIATFDRTAKELGNSSIKAWNWLSNSAQTQAGDPRLGNLNKSALAVENELAALFKGTGATDQEIKAWRAELSSSSSPEQFSNSVKTLLELAGGRMSALEDQWTKGMGRNPKPEEFQLLSPDSQKIFEALAGGQSAPQSKSMSLQQIQQIAQHEGKSVDAVLADAAREGYSVEKPQQVDSSLAPSIATKPMPTPNSPFGIDVPKVKIRTR